MELDSGNYAARGNRILLERNQVKGIAKKIRCNRINGGRRFI
jgi:hypothetical protein